METFVLNDTLAWMGEQIYTEHAIQKEQNIPCSQVHM